MADPRVMNANVFNGISPNTRQENGGSSLPLPLNLIALIISYLDRPSDLARMCRTCRVFHYMTLPQLYSCVSLRSYGSIRYDRDRRAHGCGMASPFTMGLNGLVSRNVAGYVKRFEICGEWKEHEPQELAKVGRVPDESMMMNSLVRVAVERMDVLDSFDWQINTKMLSTAWQGLAQKPSLTKLTIRFPTSRTPRPIAVAPPLPNLQYLKVTDIDPLCYPDDISHLLLGSKKLQHLKLHYSPRMRDAREPSVHAGQFYGRIMAANYVIPLKTVATQNLYTSHDDACDSIIDMSTIEEVTFLNSTSGLGDDGSTVFVDGHYHKPKGMIPPALKMVRVDKISRHQCEFLSQINGLERLYLLGPHTRPRSKDTLNDTTPLPHSPESTGSSPGNYDPCHIQSLKEDYLSAITKKHGSTLQHLLLPPQWRLTDDDIALIVRSCPNLTQLAFGAEFHNFKNLRLMVPFLRDLTALRLLGSPDDNTFTNKMRELDEIGMHEKHIGDDTTNRDYDRLKWMEVGAEDQIFEIGKLVPRGEGKHARRREVWKRPLEAVMDVDIWKMDCLEI